MAGTPIDSSSSLVSPEPVIDRYTWLFRIPPRCILQKKVKATGSGLLLHGLQCNTGLLSGVKNNGTLSFRPNQISVQLDLQQHDDHNNRYMIRGSFLEFGSQEKEKSRHGLNFQPTIGTAFTPTMLWYACWRNNGSWDDTVDTIRISFRVFLEREFAGMCYEDSHWFKRSVQCIAELVPYEQRDYKGYFQDTYLADVTIFCRGKTFPAHKMVLSNRSPEFKKILSQDLETKETVTINDFDPEVIQLFLKFMYSGELVDLIRESMVNSLLEVADMFKVEALRMLCDHQLTDRVTLENCMDYLKKSVKMNAPFLREKCWKTITKNVTEVMFGENDKENFLFLVKQFPDLVPKLIKMADSD